VAKCFFVCFSRNLAIFFSQIGSILQKNIPLKNLIFSIWQNFAPKNQKATQKEKSKIDPEFPILDKLKINSRRF
jgi:hypothetical protein